MYTGQPEHANDGIERVTTLLEKDRDGNVVIQEDMLWGDSLEVKHKPKYSAAYRAYVDRYYPNEAELRKVGRVKDLWAVMRQLRVRLKDSARVKFLAEFLPLAYQKYNITYVEGNKVLPATNPATVKKSYLQDYSDSNMRLLTIFWDHHLQRETLWASMFGQEVMKANRVVFDKSYSTFRDSNKTKNGVAKRGPKRKNGMEDLVNFTYKMLKEQVAHNHPY